MLTRKIAFQKIEIEFAFKNSKEIDLLENVFRFMQEDSLCPRTIVIHSVLEDVSNIMVFSELSQSAENPTIKIHHLEINTIQSAIEMFVNAEDTLSKSDKVLLADIFDRLAVYRKLHHKDLVRFLMLSMEQREEILREMYYKPHGAIVSINT